MIPDPQLIDSGPAYKAAGLVHRVLRPEGNADNGRRPAVVMLHGYQGNEEVMWIFANTIPKDWLKIAPRGIETAGDSYSWSKLPQSGWPGLADFDAAVTAVVQFIHSLPDLYQVDPAQIYLMGFSQGAATAWATALAHPSLTRGIAGLVGFMPLLPNEAPFPADHWRELPIFMAAGKEDETIPLDISRRSAEAIQQLGAALNYGEYETGHRLNAAGMRNLREWWGKRP